jgi:hypothetical protein
MLQCIDSTNIKSQIHVFRLILFSPKMMFLEYAASEQMLMLINVVKTQGWFKYEI